MRPVRTLLSSVLNRYPLNRGYEALALSRPLALFARNEHFGIAKLRNGSQMLVYGKDHVGRILLYMGDFEPGITRIVKTLLSSGDTVLDIGSNLGWFSLNASPIVGSNGVVHAFEPQPMLNTLLRASLTMNGIENVIVHELALSDSDGLAELRVLKGNLGAARLSNETQEGSWYTIKVRTAAAGNYLASLDLPKIRMLKIDVEGHEPTVFGAAHAFFTRNPPDVIIFESAGDAPLLDRPVAQAQL